MPPKKSLETLIRHLYLNGHSMRAIAMQLNITLQKVAMILKDYKKDKDMLRYRQPKRDPAATSKAVETRKRNHSEKKIHEALSAITIN